MGTPVEKKLALLTVGCRLNQYETEKMGQALYPHGFRRAKPDEPADLYIINTCTVTHRADSTSRYLIQKATRENPHGRIVVAGCYVESDATVIEGMEAVDVIIHNSEKPDIARILPQRLPELFDAVADASRDNAADAFSRYNRAWLKVSDGCNQRCAFCILPKVRGPLLNRPALGIIDEVRSLRTLGFNEVVLTGVNLGHYKNRQTEPQVKNLAHLCRMILAETDLPRLRLSSIEPQTVRDELLTVIADSHGRICRHMHLPLQSGSDRLLRIMHRPYTSDVYIKRVADARQTQPNTIVGADVIVGFPGETESDFTATRRIAESGLIDYLHVFSYSDRPGAPAADMGDKISPEVIKERNAVLKEVSRDFKRKAHRRQVGLVLEVIAQHRRPGRRELFGVADNYVKVSLPYEYDRGRALSRVLVTAAHDDHVSGDLLI